MVTPETWLILGGARSGKSARAQVLAEQFTAQRCFVATAEALDHEMADRIARHQRDRDGSWRTIEAPLDLTDAIRSATRPDVAVVVDCLTLWLSNLMHAGRNIARETDALLAALGEAAGPVVLVSNEVGMGLVPETPLGRAFCDAQGRLNQAVAKVVDNVEFVAAGLPIALKKSSNL